MDPIPRILLAHIDYPDWSRDLDMALDICGQFERKIEVTGCNTGATSAAFTDYLLETLRQPGLKERWDDGSRAVRGRPASPSRTGQIDTPSA